MSFVFLVLAVLTGFFCRSHRLAGRSGAVPARCAAAVAWLRARTGDRIGGDICRGRAAGGSAVVVAVADVVLLAAARFLSRVPAYRAVPVLRAAKSQAGWLCGPPPPSRWCPRLRHSACSRR